MIDATNATCIHTLSRDVADRLNAYFSCIQNSSSVRLHLTSRFRLSIESTHLVAYTIYVDFFSPPFSSHFFSYLPYNVQAKSCQKRLRGHFEKHMLANIFGKFYSCRFSLIPRASNHLYVNST